MGQWAALKISWRRSISGCKEGEGTVSPYVINLLLVTMSSRLLWLLLQPTHTRFQASPRSPPGLLGIPRDCFISKSGSTCAPLKLPVCLPAGGAPHFVMQHSGRATCPVVFPACVAKQLFWSLFVAYFPLDLDENPMEPGLRLVLGALLPILLATSFPDSSFSHGVSFCLPSPSVCQTRADLSTAMWGPAWTLPRPCSPQGQVVLVHPDRQTWVLAPTPALPAGVILGGSRHLLEPPGPPL